MKNRAGVQPCACRMRHQSQPLQQAQRTACSCGPCRNYDLAQARRNMHMYCGCKQWERLIQPPPPPTLSPPSHRLFVSKWRWFFFFLLLADCCRTVIKRDEKNIRKRMVLSSLCSFFLFFFLLRCVLSHLFVLLYIFYDWRARGQRIPVNLSVSGQYHFVQHKIDRYESHLFVSTTDRLHIMSVCSFCVVFFLVW